MNPKPTKEETKLFRFFRAGWNLAKFISSNEGFVFGATNTRCEKEFWLFLKEVRAGGKL